MDLSAAASYFDDTPVTDAYTGTSLFMAQPDLYDGSARDSMTGWRRSCSTEEVIASSRGAVAFNGEVFLAGRKVRDYFQGDVIREHLLLHPSDGLFTVGTAKAFILDITADLKTMHGALALRKEQKEEALSSQVFNVYNVYVSLTETAARDQIVKGPDGVYYRIQNLETQTGGYRTLYVSELGVSVLLLVTYTPSSGVYNVATDSSGTGTPISATIFFERYQSNYRYVRWASEKFVPGDAVVTVSATVVAAPGNSDRLTIDGIVYNVLEKQSDGLGCWELHVRPV